MAMFQLFSFQLSSNVGHVSSPPPPHSDQPMLLLKGEMCAQLKSADREAG